MEIQQRKFSKTGSWEILSNTHSSGINFDLVLVFGDTEIIAESGFYQTLRKDYPEAQILMSSTAGQIYGSTLCEKTVVATAIHFDKSKVSSASVSLKTQSGSKMAGLALARQIDPKGLKSIFVVSDGLLVNGSALVEGMENELPPETIITGGLAGDSNRFNHTLVGLNMAAEEGTIAAVAFYGDNLEVACGNCSGWVPFGTQRQITHSVGNVLYEIDGKPALELYKTYLGELANDLPSSGLLFPLEINSGTQNTVVRTLLSVNEADKSMVFAGDIPKGTYARLMQTNCDKLIQGAGTAAEKCLQNSSSTPELALLTSCVGRKMVMGPRTEEELKAVQHVLGGRTRLAGFYSYGEISPVKSKTKSGLHNQTMTVTTFSERTRNE
ncbi:MAG TPA: FIST N-terminal domain-containing protein [Flavobacteriales bacterium]|nr:FIST N-terminal domain-containing protein [Flavobacteriales bacterium]